MKTAKNVYELPVNEVSPVPVLCSIPDGTGNPAPLGLLGFGLTTILVNLHIAGLFPNDSMILAMGIFYGGFAQILAGIMEWRKNNTFAATVFTSYGLFWLSFIGLMVFPQLGLGAPPGIPSLVAYLVLWGTFTLVMFVGTFRLNRALQITFALAVILFFGLAVGDALGSSLIRSAIGFVGILCGLCAAYTGVAQVLNEVFNRVLLPLGPVHR
ncbi:MAG: acetate uptake transporter [Syntrophotaleaceae bacterium]